MLSFNPLSHNDFFDQRPGVRHGFGRFDGHSRQAQPASIPNVSTASVSIKETLNIAYEKMQSVIAGRLQSPDASNKPQTTSDFSPQAVADRVVGFIADRLEQEKADGASDDELKALYRQALQGVEQGLKEGKEIIQGQGLFQDEVKDNFYNTVNLIADQLESLGQELFGAGASQPNVPEVGGPGSFAASSSEVFLSRSRSFEMEVYTQEGDKITLTVNAGQQYASQQGQFVSDDLMVSGYSESFTQFENVAFSVEGDLNSDEMAALSDLFSQVNDVADVFYNGDVEQAFDQALTVGMDTDTLAAFSVNMNRTETVVMKEAYASVQNLSGQERFNPMEDHFSRLGAFADKLAQAKEQLAQLRSNAFDVNKLLGDVVGGLHSDSGQQDAFKQFVNRLA